MSLRPNKNKHDACCCCGQLQATPADHNKPNKDELRVWQPRDADPPQWICADCKARLEKDA